METITEKEFMERYIVVKSNILEDMPDVKFCSTYEVSLPFLDKMKKKFPDWASRALALRRESYAEGTIAVDDAIYRAAKLGDVRAAELWYKRFDSWDPRKPEGPGGTASEKKTWAEMLDVANRTQRKKKKTEMENE